MALPVGILGTDTVELSDGSAVVIHSLTAAKAFGLYAFQENRAGAPAYIIEHGTDSTTEEVAAFLDSHKLDDAVTLMNAILELSGVDDTFRARVSDGG